MMTLIIGSNFKALSRHKSFTLIEVMVSVAILSIGLMFILRGQANLINSMRIAEDNLKATHEVESRMAQAQIKAMDDPDLSLGGLDEEFKSEGVEFEWEIQAESVAQSELLKEIEATMSWEEGRRKGSVPVFTYMRKSVEETTESGL